MTKITPAQQQLLATAAATEDGMIDTPDTARTTGAALIKRGLLILVPQQDGLGRLLITEAGRAALQASPATSPEASAAKAAGDAGTKSVAGPIGKIAILVTLLKGPNGATIETMMEATGWQAHSVRGAISGSIKKKLGHPVSSEKNDTGRIYRIVGEAKA